MDSGGHYVMLILNQMMPLLCVINWDMMIIVAIQSFSYVSFALN